MKRRRTEAVYRGMGSATRRQRMLGPGAAPVANYRSSGELKCCDYPLTMSGTAVLATTNSNVDLIAVNLIAPGAGSFNRIGRKINLKSLELRMYPLHTYTGETTTEDQTGNVFRLVVVWDKQPNGSTPTWDAIFGRTNQAGTETSNFGDPLKPDNENRFVILKDKQYSHKILGSVLTGGTTNLIENSTVIRQYVSFNTNFQTNFSGNTAPCSIADISSGALYVGYRTLYAVTGKNYMSVGADSIARLKYVD
jgi:hypothetical protein